MKTDSFTDISVTDSIGPMVMQIALSSNLGEAFEPNVAPTLSGVSPGNSLQIYFNQSTLQFCLTGSVRMVGCAKVWRHATAKGNHFDEVVKYQSSLTWTFLFIVLLHITQESCFIWVHTLPASHKPLNSTWRTALDSLYGFHLP